MVAPAAGVLNHPIGCFGGSGGEHARCMDASIRVALVNDFEIVLEGLRALLQPYAPGIRVVELDVRATPERTVDVTLFDTYGEAGARRGRVRELCSGTGTGAAS